MTVDRARHFIACAVVACACLLAAVSPRPAAAWVMGGTDLTPAAGDQVAGPMATDGAGGGYILWTPAAGTCVLHFDADGNVAAGWPPAGLLVPSFSAALIAPDGAGGVTLTGGGELVHVTASHAFATSTGWPTPSSWAAGDSGNVLGCGVVGLGHSMYLFCGNQTPQGSYAWQSWVDSYDYVTQPGTGWSGLVPTSDGYGGAYFASVLNTSSGQALRLTHLAHVTGGPPGWNAPGDTVTSSLYSYADRPIAPLPVCAADTFGVLQLWTETMDGNDDVRGRFVRRDGHMLTGAGVTTPVVDITGFDSAKPACLGIVPRTGGGALTGWNDAVAGFRVLTLDSLGHKLRDLALGDDSLVPDAGMSFAPDGLGGAFAAYVSAPQNFRIVAKHVLASGLVDAAWGGHGSVMLYDDPASVSGLQVLPLGRDGFILAWTDTRREASDAGAGTDIAAIRVAGDGSIPRAVLGVASTPAALRLAILGVVAGAVPALRVTLTGRGPAALALYDVAGRRVHVVTLGDAGAGERVIALPGALSSGVYFARLREGGVAVTRRCVLLH